MPIKNIRTIIGDLFEAKLEDNTKKYFQYITNDLSQLNSSVIRAFKKRYRLDEHPKLEAVIEDDIDFYAHVILRAGLEMEL